MTEPGTSDNKGSALMSRLVGFSLAVLIVLFVAGAQGASAGRETITKQQIRSLVSHLDEVTAAGDIEALGRYLGTDFVFHMRVPDEDVTYSLGSAKYLKRLKQGYELVEDYSYQRSNVDIAIGPDGRSAVSNSRLLEFLTLHNKRISTLSMQNMHFRLQAGEIRITSISAIQQERKQSPVNAL